jgi:hypothetical protein
MSVDSGSGRAPQTVPHHLNIGAARREEKLDRLRRPLLQTKEKRVPNNIYFGPIQEGENLDLMDTSSSCW